MNNTNCKYCRYCNGTGIWISPIMGGKYPCECQTSPEQSIDSDIQYDEGSGVPNCFGDKAWKVNKEYHRIGGPAIISGDGRKEWYFNGQCHREDGPAIECPNGTTVWYLNSVKHRIDGPAVERANGDKLWYLSGIQYSEKVWEQKVRELKVA